MLVQVALLTGSMPLALCLWAFCTRCLYICQDVGSFTLAAQLLLQLLLAFGHLSGYKVLQGGVCSFSGSFWMSTRRLTSVYASYSVS